MIRVHYLKTDDDQIIAFFPDTCRFFLIDEETKAFIADVGAREKEYVLKKYGIDEAAYDDYVSKMTLPPKKAESQDAAAETGRVLSRLVLHLANDCNLRCVYCYANGGTYHSEHDLMRAETLDRIVDVFYKEYDHIGRIQFFGGEPLLNMELIDRGAERIKAIEQSRGNKTEFGVVVNGTLINDRFAELVKKHELDVTVSFDGDPAINDRLRVFPNGKGSSEVVLNNIRKLREATGQPATIEATYTRFHAEAGISPMETVDRIKELVPGIRIHLAPAGGNADCSFALQDVEAFPSAVAEIARRRLENPGEAVNSFATADQYFRALERKDEPANAYICGAGLGTLAVSTKGDIYPCFMFADVDEMNMGNVSEEDVFRSERFRTVWQRVLTHNCKENHPECRDCFANGLCFGCMGADYLQTGELFRLSERNCISTRRMIEEAIKGQAKLYGEDGQETEKDDEAV